MTLVNKRDWAARIEKELRENILPFWMRNAVDRETGGFYGKIDCDGHIGREAPRASVIHSRILWTFSAACRLVDVEYRATADWAYDYIVKKFWDAGYGGV